MYIRLDELRTEVEFEHLITKVEEISGLAVSVSSSTLNGNQCHQLDEEAYVRVYSTSAKRKRKCPAQMTDYVVHTKTANKASTLNEKTELMRKYFETLDVVKNAAKLRFHQYDLHILKVIERFILNAANNKCSEIFDLVKDLNKYADIIKLNELTITEAQELHVYIKQYNNKKKKSNPSYTPM